MIDTLRDTYNIKELCDTLGVSTSGYYAARKRPLGKRYQENKELIQIMHSVHQHRHTRSYGSPRMTHVLRSIHGYRCSENRVARLMRTGGIRAKPRKPFRPKTTRPDHAAHPSPNLLLKTTPPTAPGQQLVSDITYIPTREGWLFLAIVMDLFSRSILGWKLSERQDAEIVTASLRRALDSRMVANGAIFHSDRGSQYTAKITRTLLTRSGLRQSMSAAGYCYDNAFAESAFASIKNELLEDHAPLPSKAEARLAVFDYIEIFYNRSRLHSSLNFLSPYTFLKNYFQNLNSALN